MDKALIKEFNDLCFRIKDADTYRACMETVKNVRQVMISRAKFSFDIGSKVMFKGKHGMTVHGTVTKINRTTASVTDTLGGKWRVGLSILKASDRKAA